MEVGRKTKDYGYVRQEKKKKRERRREKRNWVSRV